MTKHDAMIAYLKPHVTDTFGVALGFNFSSDSAGSVGFMTEYANKIIKSYVRAAQKAYGFAILIIQPYSQNTDDLNLNSMNLAQAFGDWIDAQNKQKVFPDFGNKCTVQKIESLQNMPNVAEVSEDSATAKYMLQCKVTYYEED